jgi:hypothetical protein
VSILELRDEITAGILAGIPTLGSCQTFGGRLAQGDIKRFAMKSPAVLVACLGIPSIQDDGGGEIDAVCTWGAFVVTTDRPQLPRDTGALAIVAALATLIPNNYWDGKATGIPEKIKGDNLYNGSIDGAGVALWVVTWQQKTTLGGLDMGDLDDFLLLHADYDLAPPDGVIEALDDINVPQ